jgi:hypothetical protein
MHTQQGDRERDPAAGMKAIIKETTGGSGRRHADRR